MKTHECAMYGSSYSNFWSIALFLTPPSPHVNCTHPIFSPIKEDVPEYHFHLKTSPCYMVLLLCTPQEIAFDTVRFVAINPVLFLAILSAIPFCHASGASLQLLRVMTPCILVTIAALGSFITFHLLQILGCNYCTCIWLSSCLTCPINNLGSAAVPRYIWLVILLPG